MNNVCPCLLGTENRKILPLEAEMEPCRHRESRRQYLPPLHIDSSGVHKSDGYSEFVKRGVAEGTGWPLAPSCLVPLVLVSKWNRTPRTRGKNRVIIVTAEKGRRETTASEDWDMTRRKRSNGDTDEREGEEGPATGPTLETIRPPSIKKHFYQKFICTNFLIFFFIVL